MTTPKKATPKIKAATKAAIDKLNRTPAKATKPAAPTKEAQPAPDTRKIKILVKENPYRENSKAYVTFELLKKSATVEAFLQSCAKNPSTYARGYWRYCW